MPRISTAVLTLTAILASVSASAALAQATCTRPTQSGLLTAPTPLAVAQQVISVGNSYWTCANGQNGDSVATLTGVNCPVIGAAPCQASHHTVFTGCSGSFQAEQDYTWDITCSVFCPAGQAPDSITGTCACPASQRLAGGKCLTDESKNNDPSDCSKVLDPVSAATGGVIEDIRVPEVGFTLRYASTMRTAGRFGLQWSDPFERHIGVGNAGMMQVLRGGGVLYAFIPDSTGTNWHSTSPDIADQLIKLASGWRYIDFKNGAMETFDLTPSGRPTQIARLNGFTQILRYYDGSTAGASGGLAIAEGGTAVNPAQAVPAGMLRDVIDSLGRVLHFDYDPNSRVSRVTSGGSTVLAYHDANAKLTQLGFDDGTTRKFRYDDPDHPSGLTSILDESGNVHSQWTYDASGRGISAARALGALGGTLTYSDSDLTASVTMPSGAVQAYSFTVLNGVALLSGVSQPAGSGCAASTSYQTYDASGNVASKDDFNGNRVCYVSDLSRNLESVRVEGLSNTATCSTYTAANAAIPAGSRKVSTLWHPDWRLETKVAEPGRLTTKVYNGQPDPFNGNALASCAPAGALLPDGKPIAVLCKQVEQATTDTDGRLGLSATLQAGVPNRQRSWSCRRRSNIDPPCRSNTDPGMDTGRVTANCG